LDFGDNAAANTALSFITFIILYNNLIPISLYVSVEIVKFMQGSLFQLSKILNE
jgi:phospholipid-transporting ATPase